MKIDVKHIAKLARLHVEDDSVDKIERDMEQIINMVEKLPDISEDIKLDDSEAMVLREDIAVANKYKREDLLKNAPEVKSGCLVVPKTVE